MVWFKATRLWSHTVSESQESRSGFRGGSGSRSHEVAIKMSAGLQPSKRLTATEGPLPRRLTHVAVGKAAPPQRAARVSRGLAAGFRTSDWSKKESGRSHSVLYHLASEVMLCHLGHRSALFMLGGDCTRTRIFRGVNHGSVVEAGCCGIHSYTTTI